MADDFEAPLAKTEEFNDFGDFQVSTPNEECQRGVDAVDSNYRVYHHNNSNGNDFEDSNFADSFSASLEDLVNTFDEKITNCFQNYNESVEAIAPVRSHEEILNESSTWRSLTENFGNILPFDFEKSHTRALQLQALNLPSKTCNIHLDRYDEDDDGIDEEELAKDFDLHSLIFNSCNSHQEPMFTAEQVLREINEMMGEEETSLGVGSSISTTAESSPSGDYSLVFQANECPSSSHHKTSVTNGYQAISNHSMSALFSDGKWKHLSSAQLNELIVELERMIQSLSETLIQELALRDELEFEKEIKNNFISLLLSIQNKKRQYNLDKKKVKSSGSLSKSSSTDSMKYLTTVIPYDPTTGPPDLHSLQILMKILKAIDEDNPTVPTLLTDYILKVLCPTL